MGRTSFASPFCAASRVISTGNPDLLIAGERYAPATNPITELGSENKLFGSDTVVVWVLARKHGTLDGFVDVATKALIYLGSAEIIGMLVLTVGGLTRAEKQTN